MWCAPACGVDIACAECTRGTGRFAAALGNGDVNNAMKHIRNMMPKRAEPCLVECAVRKVVIHRRRSEAGPMLGWLTGHKKLLFVEISPLDAKQDAKRTQSGVVHEEGVRADSATEEAWIWGAPIRMNHTGSLNFVGEKLVFDANTKTEFILKVLGSHTSWSDSKAPEEMLGEARFRVDDDIMPAVIFDGALSLPIVQEGRVRGIATLSVRVRCSSDNAVSNVGRWVKQNRLVRLKGHTDSVTSCALFPFGGRILTVSRDNTGIIWSTAGEQLSVIQGHTGPVNHCAVFPSGDQVLTVSDDETAIIWSSVGKKLVVLSGVKFCVIFPAGDKILAGGDVNGAIFSNTGEQIAALRGHADVITAGAVFPGGKRVLTVSKDEDAIIWSSEGDTIRVLRGHHDCITGCAIFPSGEQVLTVSQDRTGIIWSSSGPVRAMGKQLAVLRGHTDKIRGCAVFRDGDRVVTWSDDERAIIWSVSGDRLAELKGHTGPVTSCRIFPQGDMVLTTSTDKTGAIWTATGEQLAELCGHTSDIYACSIFPGGESVLTVSGDGLGIIWPMSLYLHPRTEGQ